MDRSDTGEVSGRRQTPIALTIAGSDSGGGAGIQADLKTFAALGVYGACAITALTAQNTLGVRAIHAVPAAMVRAEIDAVLDDFAVAAVKIGMLANAGIVDAVADALMTSRSPLAREGGAQGAPDEGSAPTAAPSCSGYRPRYADCDPFPAGGEPRRAFIVYDPVLAATSGDPLAGAGFVEAITKTLLPLVDCLTPNLPEAAALTGGRLAVTEADMIAQGQALLDFGPRAALMKGGHLDGAEAVDLLVTAEGVQRFAAAKIVSPNTHGTGCTLSSAIAAHIVLGLAPPAAVAAAKAFVRASIEAGRDLKLGAGAGPLIQFTLKT